MSLNKMQRIEIVHSELDSLQRKFRDMEAKHRLFNNDSIQTIRMQRSKITKIKTENERLKEELALETRHTKRSRNSYHRHSHSNTHSINNKRHRNISTLSAHALQEQSDIYQTKIEVEKRKILSLEQQIRKMSEGILQQRSAMGGINANRETSKTIQKNIRMLENRLDKALVKYNEALGHNKKLRATIDNLRRERVVFDGIYRKLEGDLLQIKNEMATVINEANSAYEVRDSCQAEMLRLKEEFDKEQKLFEVEWRELTKLIEKDEEMNDFLNISNKDKISDTLVNTVLEEEQELRKKLSAGSWKIVKDKAHIHMAQEKVENYKQSFLKIQNATGIENIDELVQTFITAEEQNFKLFNQVNKLSNDIERCEENINNSEYEIARITGTHMQSEFENKKHHQMSTNVDNQRNQILNDLQQQIVCTENQTLFYQSKHMQQLQTMSNLKEGIQQILKNINLREKTLQSNEEKDENEDMTNMLNMINNTGVTESNIMQIFGFIEGKTNELIDEYLSVSNVTGDESNVDDTRVLIDSEFSGSSSSRSREIYSQCLDDCEAEAAALGIGIGAAELQPLVLTPNSILDDFSDASEDEDHEQEPFSQQQLMQQENQLKHKGKK